MIISTVEVIPVRLPLREPFVVAYATYPDTLSVLVRIRTRDGLEGWGEATPDPNVTGETWSGVAQILRHDLAPALIGRDARDREAALLALDARVEGAPAAKAALDIALHDLLARSLGIPLWQLLGGRIPRRRYPSPASSAWASRKRWQRQRRATSRPVSAPSRRKSETAPPQCLMCGGSRLFGRPSDPISPSRSTSTKGWHTPGVAIGAIRAMLPSLPAYIEQPVVWWDLEGLAEVRRQTGALIMIDEGCHGPRDMLRAVALRAADLVNIKLMKTGGILNALKLNAIAETAGIPAQIGTMVESSIASAAGLHTATALANVRTVEMGGPLMLAEDIGNAGSWYRHDTVTVPDAPGLGIDVDT